MMETVIISLILTLVLEFGYAWFWGVRKTDLRVVAVANVITNPLVVYWTLTFSSQGYVLAVLLPELIAVTAEALLLRNLGKNIRRPLLLAVCMNVFSYFTGVLIQYFIFGR